MSKKIAKEKQPTLKFGYLKQDIKDLLNIIAVKLDGLEEWQERRGPDGEYPNPLRNRGGTWNEGYTVFTATPVTEAVEEEHDHIFLRALKGYITRVLAQEFRAVEIENDYYDSTCEAGY